MSPGAALAALRAAERRDGRPDLAARRAALDALAAELRRRAEDVAAAAAADFGGRSRIETLLAEVLCVVDAARHARRHVRRWARPRRAAVPLPFLPARAVIEPVPKGVVGVIAPWNYPVQLALWPLVDALAAGNRVALKPSERTPRVAALLAELLAVAPGESLVRVVQGDAGVAAAFAAQGWDHLFYTGSAATGRQVLAAAASNLVPLTLELGGKCPAVVLPGADLAAAARAILVGKALNAGQTCVAPDTVLLIGHSAAAFAAACRAVGPLDCETAVHPANAARLAALCAGARLDPLSTAATPIVLAAAAEGSALAQEEIFGPILLVQEAAGLDAAVGWIAARGEPLAIYLFGADAAAEARIAAGTRSGAIVHGRCVDHVAFPGLGFGGVGASGFGRYHGRAGFDTFSDCRARVRHGPFALARLFDPPRGGFAESLIRRLLR
jgi:acyl-CoA reductase-like NAD-dependent aldehyde dehydrogenase